MVLLKKTETNSVILTLTESETTYSGVYYLNIYNPQDDSTVSDIFIQDISTNVERYNEFLIVLVDDETETERWSYTGSPLITVLYNFIPGLYDYTAKDANGNVLEIGKLRIQTVDDTPVETYRVEPTEYIYKK